MNYHLQPLYFNIVALLFEFKELLPETICSLTNIKKQNADLVI